jgi:hypothetical protein
LSLRLLSWTFSPGPKDEGEPHIAGIYDAIGKAMYRTVAGPLVAIFGVSLLVTAASGLLKKKREPGGDASLTTANDLPKAVASSVDGPHAPPMPTDDRSQAERG